MTALALEGVSKRFGEVTAVDNVSLSVESSEFIALLGASGCGKSTMLRLLAGLERPTAGRVLLGGRDVTDETASARNIALMFQSYALYPHVSVYRNIATPLRFSRLSGLGRAPGARLFSAAVRETNAAIDADVRRVADMLRIDHLLHRKPAQLSGGQQQRVALARSLVRAPTAFLLDEPLSNLDTQLRADTRDEIKALHRREGRPFILVTHDQADALSMADRVVVMVDGRIAQLDSPTAIFDRPANRDVAQFIGAHRMNLIEPGAIAAALHPAGAKHVVGVRPEQLTLDAPNGLPAVVDGASFQGEETLFRLKAADGTILQSLVHGAARGNAPSAHTALAVAPGGVHLFDAISGLRVETSAS